MGTANTMEWRQCVRFPAYEVSECGDVRRIADSITRLAGFRPKGVVDCDGYIRFSLLDCDGNKRSVAAHRLVAEAFVGPQPSPAHEVAHINGSRLNHHYSNLRWDTRKGNHADLQIHHTAVKGVKNGRATITEQDVEFIRDEYRAIKLAGRQAGRSVSELDRRFGLCRAQIIKIATGEAWSHIPMRNYDDTISLPSASQPMLGLI